MEGSKKQTLENPVDSANICSRLLFWWLTPFLIKGSKKELDVNDLYSVPKDDHTECLGDRLEKEWQKELEKSKSTNDKAFLWKALFRCFGLEFLLLGIFCFIEECGLHVIQPVCLGGLIQYFQQDSTMSRTDAFLYATGMVLSSFIFPFTHHPYFFGVLHVGMKLRVACCALVYRKALRLNQKALGQTTIGQMVNLLTNDVGRFDQSVIFLHYLWVGPLQVVLIVWVLWSRLYAACLVGVSILLLLIPLQSYMGHIFGRLRLRTAKVTDQRIQVMNEVISGIRVIKMYTWEQPFAKLVDEIRRREVKILTKTSFVRALNMAIFSASSKIILLLTFLTMILENDALTAENVFMTVALYNNIRLVMTLFFPFGISQGAETVVSINRLQKFLLLEEKVQTSEDENDFNKADSPSFSDGHRIVMENVGASWGENIFSIKHISFVLDSNQLLAIIGPVGSGKSSLLMTILKELTVNEGRFEINGTIAYASQEPWIFQGSVKKNILMGNKYNEARYQDVIQASALDKDLTQFPNGDMTEIGDKGSTLSGGQKARISLARALYIDADIYLLDDPLSAVDASVGSHLFKKCIETYLKNKACILVTHQVQFLKHADHILVLNEGQCIASGTYQQLANADLNFVNLKRETSVSELEHHLSTTSLKSLVDRSLSVTSLKDVALADLTWKDKEFVEVIDRGASQEEETRSHGVVGLKLYWQYFHAGANWFFLTILLFVIIVTEILFCASEYWLTVWTKAEERRRLSLEAASSSNITVSSSLEEQDHTNLYIYALLVGALFVVVLFKCAMFFYSCLRSSIHLHNSMFHTIILVPMRFFEKNPVGRILNRFSKDIGIIDELLPPCLDDCIDIGFRLVGIIILVAMVNYWIIIPSLVLAIMFHCLRKFYLYTARDIKRIEGVTRSPVYSHLSSSFHGLTTIRAFQAEDLFRHQFEMLQDQHSAAWFLFLCTGRWLGIWLDWICNIYIAIVTYSLLFASDVMGGDVGLAITSALLLSGMCQWGVRQSAEAENLMISVERVLEYSRLESDAPINSSPDKKPPSNWPFYGIITFEHVYVRYSPLDEPILKNLYFCIRASEKVGVVGRTGAGKSSLLSALFRLVDHEGEIKIDGITIKEIGLHDLRKKLSVIPQDPILFMGTMRYNLDPFSEHADDELWTVLEDVQLKELITELPGQLNSELHEGGANLSVGQRQLVCLARAILCKNKILVLDEATANVDQTTDSFIQRTIRQKFISCTVITVAHRLNTIMDSDRVMVLDAGRVVEFDEPYVLLQDETSKFSTLVEMTGKSNAKQLKAMAQAAYIVRTTKIADDTDMTTEYGVAPLVEAESLADEEYTYI